ncbi:MULTISPECIES: dipeptidase [Bacillaceae]|uniref:Dipeptidase n=1 Tax=Evansella alkalicola TaxID=745819 RepID=A0ABS6JNB4_9BACI|nr:dipeptidase [Litchfieldia alkalitelluris]MBU9720058.1 dipeptidase [Bacillus alkalicola]
MQVFDLHCDALLKLWEDKSRSYTNHPSVETNFERLQQGKVRLQLFAIFIEPYFPSDIKFQIALEQIDLFHKKVIEQHPNMKKIVNWNDIHKLKDGEIGALLTLEGADAFGNDLTKLRTLYQLGVKSIGLTWNNANLTADGVGEPRGGGLTELGFEVVHLNNEQMVWTDVSHLAEAGFWNVMNSAQYPIASHSNSKTICNHRRNLTDEQAQALFQKNGFIGLVFNPPFINGEEQATIDDLLKHVEHFCALGGKNHVSFGSDFDGISYHVKNLEHAGKYPNFINELLKRYSEADVRGFAYENVLKSIPLDNRKR